MLGAYGGSDSELDYDRHRRTASDESVELPARQRAATLVERGGARKIRSRARG